MGVQSLRWTSRCAKRKCLVPNRGALDRMRCEDSQASVCRDYASLKDALNAEDERRLELPAARA
jgi:hypothetical protein